MSLKISKQICKFLIFNIACICFSMSHAANDANNLKKEYLKKPTGPYGVGFENVHWINPNICPDPNFNGKNKEDFSANNPNFCHEIIVRIYYPTLEHNQRSQYYRPIIKTELDSLKDVPNITSEQKKEVEQLQSFSIEKASIISGKNFPVLLFSPGFGCPAELYENFITELVSQGYIVVGINTVFINTTELPNGHLVESARPADRDEVEAKFVPLQSQDLLYAFAQIHNLHRTNPIFAAMDLKHIGTFGHSIGARILADVVHANPSFFQAAVTLDIGFDTTGKSTKEFAIPFMHQVAADRIASSVIPVEFDLGNNNYLVGMTPSEKNHRYTSHMNFSDVSTFQYLPALQIYQNYLRQHALDGFSLKFMSHDPTVQDCQQFDKYTYVLIKKELQWTLIFYDAGQKVTDIPTKLIVGLDVALAKLPNKLPEQLTELEISVVKNIMMEEHKLNFEQSGTGNGWDITSSINQYLLKFFNHFLKHDLDSAFQKCTVLAENSYIKCGPGQVKQSNS